MGVREGSSVSMAGQRQAAGQWQWQQGPAWQRTSRCRSPQSSCPPQSCWDPGPGARGQPAAAGARLQRQWGRGGGVGERRRELARSAASGACSPRTSPQRIEVLLLFLHAVSLRVGHGLPESACKCLLGSSEMRTGTTRNRTEGAGCRQALGPLITSAALPAAWRQSRKPIVDVHFLNLPCLLLSQQSHNYNFSNLQRLMPTASPQQRG